MQPSSAIYVNSKKGFRFNPIATQNSYREHYHLALKPQLVFYGILIPHNNFIDCYRSNMFTFRCSQLTEDRGS